MSELTVRQLIAALREIEDQDMPAIVEGYEDGYESVSGVEVIQVYMHVRKRSYFGEHEEAPDTFYEDEGHSATVAAFVTSRM